MEYLPSSEEFSDFSNLIRSITPISVQAHYSVCSSVPEWLVSPSIQHSLKHHPVYNFLINDPSFNKAVKNFKHTVFYKKCVEKSEILHERIELQLMRIIAATAAAYLAELTINTQKSRKAYLVNRKTCNAQIEKIEEKLKSICRKFPYFDSSEVKKNILLLKDHINAKTPSWYPERYSGYVAERLIVERVSHLFKASFDEILVKVIKHLANMIFVKYKAPSITLDLFKEWIHKVKDEVLATESTASN